MLLKEFQITSCLPFFFQTDGHFDQNIWSHTLGRGPKEPLIKISNIIRDKAFRKNNKVYYYFNANGDKFNENLI